MTDNRVFKITGSLAFGKDEQTMLNDKRMALLEQIGDNGSIAQVAKVVGLSYKGAWDAVDAMNSMFGEPLVISVTGGRGGGNTQLSSAGILLWMLIVQYVANKSVFWK